MNIKPALCALFALFCLISTQHASASSPQTPVQKFRDVMNTPASTIVPPFWVTWDEDSKEARKLWDENFDRFLSVRKAKAAEHQRFIDAIYPRSGIKYDERGSRIDRLDIEEIEITPRQILLWMSDDTWAFNRHAVRWSSAKGCLSAIRGEEAFRELLDSMPPEKMVDASQALLAFHRDANEAAKLYDLLIAGSASVDQKRRLRAFIDKYSSL